MSERKTDLVVAVLRRESESAEITPEILSPTCPAGFYNASEKLSLNLEVPSRKFRLVIIDKADLEDGRYIGPGATFAECTLNIRVKSATGFLPMEATHDSASYNQHLTVL
jgi:hypothetical protein